MVQQHERSDKEHRSRQLLELASLENDTMMEAQQQDRQRQRNPPERSVSFNRDVHVKKFGRSSAEVTTGLAGDGEGTFIAYPLRKESVKSLSREDVAKEAARVLKQADSVDCFARVPLESRKFASLPGRGRKSKERSVPAGGSPLGTPKPKKKALERSVSDATSGPTGIKQSISKLIPSSTSKLDPKQPVERRREPPVPAKPVHRSYSDAGARPPRARPPSSETSSNLDPSSRTLPRKPLTPIIESSPQVVDHQPFYFEPGAKRPLSPLRSQSKLVSEVTEEHVPRVKTIPIYVESENRTISLSRRDVDEVDNGMLHRSSRYDQQQRADESTIHKMIHRLSNDRSPPPQLPRTMVSPSPGFAHNNNRPFSYTRPNEPEHSIPQTDVIYAQVQLDKKKAAAVQRSHSDSDEGLGLERKDSSRENSPAEKESFHRQYYLADSELQRNNEINSFKSRYDSPQPKSTIHFGDENKPSEKYTSTIFVDASNYRGRADGMDSKRRDNNEFSSRIINERPPNLNKTSELSARRDLLESRIKMFSSKSSLNLSKKVENEIIDKPIVPSPVVPTTPKRIMDTYISETRTNSNGEKYIFEKEIHDENGKVYGFEKITNKVTNERIEPSQPKEGYTVETRTDKYGDKYIVETRKYNSDFKVGREGPLNFESARMVNGDGKLSSSLHSYSKNEDRLKSNQREFYQSKGKKNFEAMRGKSKSTQRLDDLSDSPRVKSMRESYVTRSYENLASADYVNQRELRRPQNHMNFSKRHLDDVREGPHDDYDTDISQATNSQLESSKFFKETRMTQRYLSSRRGLHDEYDSSPPRLRGSSQNGYSSSRYDSDTTARESLQGSRYNLRKERILEEEPKKPLRRSRNRLDYLDDSDARESSRSKSLGPAFDEPPQRPPRHTRHELRSHERFNRHRGESRLSDSDRKDRLADSGIENDYRRDSHENDGRHESEDEGFLTMQFIKQERRHTDRNMSSGSHGGDKRRYDKYVMYYDSKPVTSKPPSGADVKKYEKKAVKKSGTMSKVKELFRKKEKKAKEDKSKKNMRSSSSGALTDDEVTMRYKEYRGDQLRSARSARDLESEINEDEYRQRRRLSTPSGSPSSARPSRLSRSTGTLTRPEQQYRDTKNTRDSQGQEAERRGWFKSLSRKNKSSNKPVDKKQRIPESEILTTGTEDEGASSAPERVSVQKNLRFFGDTDQESISSNRDHRNKRGDDHAKVGRDLNNSGHHPMGIALPPRKPSRLAESALSSGESTTGDSSQQSQNSQRSQRSVVYLHAATVGEIPSPNERRRAASREELNRPLAAHTRTVSRSVSVLAPWRPRHYREPYEINYDQQQYVKPLRRRQRSRETLSRRAKDTRRGSKDAATSKTSTINRSTIKSKDKQNVGRTVSTESLASKSRNINSRPELSRSTSVPRDPNKSAGWFKLKSKKSRA